ncbi:MAG: hypothetical protein P8X86_03185 [Desulfofustis sp.]
MQDIMAILPLVATITGAILVMLAAAFESFRKEGISVLGIGLFAFAFFVQLTVENGPPIAPYETMFNGMLVKPISSRTKGSCSSFTE